MEAPSESQSRSISQEDSAAPSAQASATSAQSGRPRKIKRISKACDFCHTRSIRCSPSTEDASRCQSCVEYDQVCSYDRPTKKRGAKSGKSKSVQSPPTPSAVSINTNTDYAADESWHAPNIAPQAMIVDLVEVYFEVIYPLYPLFHRPTLIYRVSRGEWQTHRPFFATIMAVCALASARVRDGALYSNRWTPKALAQPPSDAFFRAAENALPKGDISAARELDYLRACCFLTLTALQNREISKMHYYLGFYDMFVKCCMLHDEKYWTSPMGVIEKEERRRLFWAMYAFEVYAAAVWGSVVSGREAQTNVHYPAEVDDDYLSITTEEGVNQGRSSLSTETSLAYTLNGWGSVSGPVNWLRGWNFVVDLYRVLEHALDGFRKRSPETDHTRFVADVWKMKLPLQSAVLDAMMHKYDSLPVRFRQTLPISLNQREDLFSFQAANIAATIQLVRMTLLTSAEATPLERCDILAELVTTFARVPVAYLRAMSTPILHHLASIGTILESVFEEPVNEECYEKVRFVLIALADLLSSLEAGMGGAAGASDRLRSQVHRMDGYMQQQRAQHITRTDVPPQSHTGEQQHNILPLNQPAGGVPHSQQYKEGAMLGQHAAHATGQNGSDFQFSNNPPQTMSQPQSQQQQQQQQQQQSQQQPQQPQSQQQQQQMQQAAPESFYSFPAEVFEDWNWAFDFTQTTR